MFADVKLLSTVKFTTKVHDPNSLLEKNEYYPRILIAKESFIGNGLDCDDVYQVVNVGFPTSILDAIQEMGRCGRNRSNTIDANVDKYSFFINSEDFVYLNQRLYQKLKEYIDEARKNAIIAKTIPSTIPLDVDRKQQRLGLLKILQSFLLFHSCVHKKFENYCSSPLMEQQQAYLPCHTSCHICNNHVSS